MLPGRATVPSALAGKAASLIDGPEERSLTQKDNWSPESHQSKENPFLAAVTFLASAKGRKTRQKEESQPGSILTTRWLDALQVVAVVGLRRVICF